MKNGKINDTKDFIKAIVRPYLIMYSWTLVGMMYFNQMEIPPLLLGVATTIVIEYFGERAVKRLKEIKKGQEK